MRFSTSAVLALPLLAAAAESPFEQYKAKFQNFLGSFGASAPSIIKQEPVAAAKAKVGAKKIDVLTLENWKDTLYGPVKAESTQPEEWWLLVTGGNKTCFGTAPGPHLIVSDSFSQLTIVSGRRPLPQGRESLQRDGSQVRNNPQVSPCRITQL
jgi:hypothetical protein